MSEQNTAYGLIELMLTPTKLLEKDEYVEFAGAEIAVVGHTVIGSELDIVMRDANFLDVIDPIQDKLSHWYVAPKSTWWESPICRVVMAMEVVFDKTYCIDAGEYEYDTFISFVGLVDVDVIGKAVIERLGDK